MLPALRLEAPPVQPDGHGDDPVRHQLGLRHGFEGEPPQVHQPEQPAVHHREHRAHPAGQAPAVDALEHQGSHVVFTVLVAYRQRSGFGRHPEPGDFRGIPAFQRQEARAEDRGEFPFDHVRNPGLVHPHLPQHPALAIQDADHLREAVVAVHLQAAGNLGNPMQDFGEQPVPDPEGLLLLRRGTQQFHPEGRFRGQDRVPPVQRPVLAEAMAGACGHPLQGVSVHVISFFMNLSNKYAQKSFKHLSDLAGAIPLVRAIHVRRFITEKGKTAFSVLSTTFKTQRKIPWILPFFRGHPPNLQQDY